MTKLQILFILHLPPPVHGAAMMGKYIHDSELVNVEFDSHYINLAIASSLEDIGKVSIKKLWHFIRLLRTIRSEVKRTNPDLVYITPNAKGGAFYKEWVIVMMLKAMGCRIVAHYHNRGVSTRQNRWLDDWMYRGFFKNLKVILLAEALYADIRKYVSREDVYICPNGIPVTEDVGCRMSDVRCKGEDSAITRLLFLSNLLVDKGVLVLLDALKILKDKGRTFACDFVGGETAAIDAKRFEEEVSRRGLDGVAFYKGKKYGAEKDAMFREADMFVFPTFYHNECFPLVLLEAMQHGLPVVTTDVGGIADIVDDGKTGFLVACHDERILADKVEALLSDKVMRREMGLAGQKKYMEEFTLDRFERRFCDILSVITGRLCSV